MAAGPSPIDSAVSQMLMQELAGGGAGGPSGGGGMPGMLGGGMPGMPGGSPEAAANAQLERELASLRQADPAALLKGIIDLKSQLLTYITQTGMSIPGVARALSKALGSFDAAIKEAQTAAATASITQMSPIQHSALGVSSTGGTPFQGGM